MDQKQLYALARQALDKYAIGGARVRLASQSTNTIFKVTARDGQNYALRLASPGWRTLTDLQSEGLWLEALAHDPHSRIGAPHVLRTREGELVAVLSEGARATVTSWLPGRLLGKHLIPANLRKMGALFAALHAQAASWTPPPEFAPGRFDRLFARGEPVVLFEPDVAAAYPAGGVEVIQRARARVDAAYATLDPADLRVIHCDLWHDNIKLHQGRLLPFDFEDTILGYRLHDIAMALLDLRETVGPERYDPLFAAFQSGYTAHLAWPEGDLDALQMGRMLWKLNFIARHHRNGLAGYAIFFAALCERFLATGRVVL